MEGGEGTGHTGSFYVTQVGLKLAGMPLPWLAQCWDPRLVQPAQQQSNLSQPRESVEMASECLGRLLLLRFPGPIS